MVLSEMFLYELYLYLQGTPLYLRYNLDHWVISQATHVRMAPISSTISELCTFLEQSSETYSMKHCIKVLYETGKKRTHLFYNIRHPSFFFALPSRKARSSEQAFS